MINLMDYLEYWSSFFPALREPPWKITSQAQQIVGEKIKSLGPEYSIRGQCAIHKSAVIEANVTMKGPVIISKECFVGANAYLRNGVFLGDGVSVGPGCEIKSTFIMPHSSLAHFNFAGDSMIGSYVNMEAGAIIANHYNERENKMISVVVNNERLVTGVDKFGALVGDHAKIGANAVLSPGTILSRNSIVNRLALVEQQ